jgi:hypothetical protein
LIWHAKPLPGLPVEVGLTADCEFGEPGQCCLVVESSRRSQTRRQLLQVGGRRLPVQLKKAFVLAEPVKAGGDDGGSLLVGGTGELGIELQGGGALGVTESPGDGIEVDAVPRNRTLAFELCCLAGSRLSESNR